MKIAEALALRADLQTIVPLYDFARDFGIAENDFIFGECVCMTTYSDALPDTVTSEVKIAMLYSLVFEQSGNPSWRWSFARTATN